MAESRSPRGIAASLRKPDAKSDRLHDIDHLHSIVLYLQESKRDLEEQLRKSNERGDAAETRASEADTKREAIEERL